MLIDESYLGKAPQGKTKELPAPQRPSERKKDLFWFTTMLIDEHIYEKPRREKTKIPQRPRGSAREKKIYFDSQPANWWIIFRKSPEGKKPRSPSAQRPSELKKDRNYSQCNYAWSALWAQRAVKQAIITIWNRHKKLEYCDPYNYTKLIQNTTQTIKKRWRWEI